MLDDLRLVVDSLPDAVIVHAAGKVVWANRSADRMFGHGDGEIIGRTVLSLVAPAEQYAIAQRFRELRATGIAGPPRETHLCRHGGTHFLAEVSAVSVNFRGEPAIMTVCRDLTEKQQSLERLRAGMHNLLDGFVVLEALRGPDGAIHDFRVVEANQQAASFAGRPLVGLQITRAWPEQIPALIRSVEDRTPLTIDSAAGDRTYRWHLIPLADGIAVNVRDASAETRAQRQLELSAVILSTMSEGVMMVRRSDSTVVYVNPFMARTFGYEPEELIGRDPRMLRPTDLSPAEVARREAVLSRIRSEPGEVEVEMSGQRKDGTRILLRSRGSVHQHPEHGTVDVFVMEDVTALRAAERDRDEQERAVHRSLAEKDVLLREIHHRVKNNLQVISSLLALKARRTRDPVAHDALRESQARVRAIAILHERLFRNDDLARVDMGEYARSVAGEVLRSFGARDRLDCRVSGPEMELSLDIAVPCGLILNELVTNAVKHAFPDERSGHITVTLAAEEEAVALTVADDGVGDTGPLDKPGSLGVTLVRTLASQLDGEATFTVGEGTTCRVRFPAKTRAA